MQDVRTMQLGQIVDFCIEYNERHSEKKEEPEKENKSSGTKYRYATAGETKAYFG